MNGVRHSNGQTDAELMQAAKVDEGAFAELYGRHVCTHGFAAASNGRQAT